MSTATLFAGIPATNLSLYHRIRFLVGDPVALCLLPDGSSTLILRDIEMERARAAARADRIACPADFAPGTGLSGDRETATAQAAAECLRQAGATSVIGDRSLPYGFVHQLEAAGLSVRCDPELGVLDRRAKDEQEIAHLRAAQQMTEQAMDLACNLVRGATALPDGTLAVDGEPLTSDRVRAAIDVFLLQNAYDNSHSSIVAGGPVGADCHDRGEGVLRTGEPVIIDIFPSCKATHYNGDCTRTVVHGTVPERVAAMHAAVVRAKQAAIAATRAGATGESVHQATLASLAADGFPAGAMPPAGEDDDWCGMTHGTGHGIGLDVHEPPLLDHGGPELVVGDALTIEPGLYCRSVGGIRIEDMVIVTAEGCENLNRLSEDL